MFFTFSFRAVKLAGLRLLLHLIWRPLKQSPSSLLGVGLFLSLEFINRFTKSNPLMLLFLDELHRPGTKSKTSMQNSHVLCLNLWTVLRLQDYVLLLFYYLDLWHKRETSEGPWKLDSPLILKAVEAWMQQVTQLISIFVIHMIEKKCLVGIGGNVSKLG